MKKSKKILIIILIIVLIILSIIAVSLFLFNKEEEDKQRQEQEEIINAEENFKNLFLNLEYSKNEDEAITLAYEMEKKTEGRFDINANVPLLNIDTDTAKNINDEINSLFGQKLLDIVNKSSVYTKYYVDYIAYTNNNIISLIIKATLKEGSDPQRIIVKTFNYDLEKNTIISLEEYLEKADLDKNIIQNQIINYIREKNESVDETLAEEYNLYIRDVRSEEYLIENVENYYIGQDGKLYIIFAYGNNTATETVDVIIVK